MKPDLTPWISVSHNRSPTGVWECRFLTGFDTTLPPNSDNYLCHKNDFNHSWRAEVYTCEEKGYKFCGAFRCIPTEDDIQRWNHEHDANRMLRFGIKRVNGGYPGTFVSEDDYDMNRHLFGPNHEPSGKMVKLGRSYNLFSDVEQAKSWVDTGIGKWFNLR